MDQVYLHYVFCPWFCPCTKAADPEKKTWHLGLILRKVAKAHWKSLNQASGPGLQCCDRLPIGLCASLWLWYKLWLWQWWTGCHRLQAHSYCSLHGSWSTIEGITEPFTDLRGSAIPQPTLVPTWTDIEVSLKKTWTKNTLMKIASWWWLLLNQVKCKMVNNFL